MVSRQLVTDQGVRMATYALNLLSRDLHCSATCIFVQVDPAPPRRSVFPFQGGKLGCLAGSIDQPGVHPIGPIAGITIPRIAYVKMQFIQSLDFCQNVYALARGSGGHHLACEKRFGPRTVR